MFLIYLLLPLVSAQLPDQGFDQTDSECLINCIDKYPVVFTAGDLRNFEKITLNIEDFCNANSDLLRCAETCSEEDQEKLSERTSLSSFLCDIKIEEFKLARECMQSQDSVAVVNRCVEGCNFPRNFSLQLDSSPSAIMHPLANLNNIGPVCRTVECSIKCSVTESNRKCAGNGDLLKDIGLKQVIDAVERLNQDLNNSSSPVTGNLAKTYLEALPHHCVFIIDPMKYETLFTTSDENEGSDVVTEIASMEDFTDTVTKSDEAGTKPSIVSIEFPDEERVSTKIFNVELETATTKEENSPTVEIEVTSFIPETIEDPEIPNKPVSVEDDKTKENEKNPSSILPELPVRIQIQPAPSQPGIEPADDSDDNKSVTPSWRTSENDENGAITNETPKSPTHGKNITIEEINEDRNVSPNSDSSDDAERMIMVVNDDDNEVNKNEVHDNQEALHQRNSATRSISTWIITILIALSVKFL